MRERLSDPLEGRDRVGRYDLIRRIGTGGVAVVYRGWDPERHADVAIKVCTSTNPKLRRRFLLEAQIAAALQHPNVTRVLELGSEGDFPYLVQELLEGEDLSAFIKRGDPMTLRERTAVLLQIARGLAYAHSQGVLHRDVKPRNVRVLPDGSVKLMDFGFAKLLDRDLNLTTKGVAIGTLGYVSPEQFRGEQVDARADVFSFGVLAYELLTGVRPFAATSFPEVSRRLLEEDPRPIHELNPEYDPRLSALIAACLVKDRDRRLAGFEPILKELEALQSGLR
ncbi:MAG: eukaryotic-like serine/threonine-protein kinase [Acidobacteriota bacterium]|nr:eukaryotic-like serine/threonine-protein kinase [Acidobacteriota bacterium]